MLNIEADNKHLDWLSKEIKNIKITKEGFIWLKISPEKAKKFIELELLDVYELFDDDRESLVCLPSNIDEKGTYGIAVGHLENIETFYFLRKQKNGKHGKT